MAEGGVGTEAEWRAFEAGAAEARRRPERVEKLAYRAPGAVSVPAQPEPGGAGAEAAAEAARAAAQAEAVAGLEERLRAAEAAAAAEAERLRREGREAAERARRDAELRGREAVDAGARQVAAALESFRREREDYFAKVEREVVELALAIAARVLRREALLDPLLLAGAARVALGQLGATTGVRLRCPAGQEAMWRETLARLPDPALAPEVEGDPAMGAGECVIEARVGSVDLGVRAQLAEIERGFFDLLERRPGGAGREAAS